VLNGLGDESTPVALDPVDTLDEVGVERHGHARGLGLAWRPHAWQLEVRFA
jgi:hypothetical protein